MPEPIDTAEDIREDTADVATPEDVLVEESLVEEVSIDGMCGVY